MVDNSVYMYVLKVQLKMPPSRTHNIVPEYTLRHSS
jgi:hypothetical protein